MNVKCAYTVKWIWGWCEMHGYKRVEVRSSEPCSVRGLCALHFSRNYTRAEYDEDKAYIAANWKSGKVFYAIILNCPPHEFTIRLGLGVAG